MSPGPCLQLDVGNSGAKWRLLAANGQTLSRGLYAPDDPAARANLLECAEALSNIWVASVASPRHNEELAALLAGRWSIEPWFASSERQAGGLVNSYEDPGKMGVDRWLAMLAARQRCDQRLCVIDAGSALTIDVVAADGRHEGGYIMPGAALMERALLLDTDRVRFEDDVAYGLQPGRSTAEAVRHGITLAQVGAVNQAISLLEETGTARLFYCGGGGQALMERVAAGGEHVPDLVFEGLALSAGMRS